MNTYLDDITGFINTSLEESFLKQKPFQNRLMLGICESFQRKENGVTQLLPGYIKNDGEIDYVGPDDEYNVIIYHRINNITPGKDIGDKGWGDGRGFNSRIARMNMVVFGMRDELQITSTEMGLKLEQSFPEKVGKDLLKQLQFMRCNIAVNDIVLNILQVFQEEYQGVAFFLKPEQFLIKLNYSIESIYSKECFINCCESNQPNTTYLNTEDDETILSEAGQGLLV